MTCLHAHGLAQGSTAVHGERDASRQKRRRRRPRALPETQTWGNFGGGEGGSNVRTVARVSRERGGTWSGGHTEAELGGGAGRAADGEEAEAKTKGGARDADLRKRQAR